ncbi:MAG: signal peptidase I [Clostridiales bacterium]|nr:signal peptidase I [Clostridiales bacterium]
MKKHNRNGHKNNKGTPKPEALAKEAEKVSETAEEVSAATEEVSGVAEEVSATAEDAVPDLSTEVPGHSDADGATLDAAEAVNSFVAENASEPDMSASSILPAELASALLEPSPEIKIGEAPAPEVVKKTEPEVEKTAEPDVEKAAEPKVERAAVPDVVEAVEPEVEKTAETAEAPIMMTEDIDVESVPDEAEEAATDEAEEASTVEPATVAEGVALLEKSEKTEVSAEAEKKEDSAETSTEAETEETKTSEEAENKEKSEKKEETEASAETEESDEDETSDDEKKNEEESAKEKSALYMFFDTLKFVAVGLLIGILLVVFVIQRNDVYGSSMEPTLHTGDAVFVEMISVYTGNFSRGDIVTIDAKGMDGYTHEENLIKRIVGLPGETIKIEDGNVYINGVLLDESSYLPAGTKTYVGAEGQARGYQEITLGPDEYYCMGDNRGGSNDSRRMGPFKKSQIDAKVLMRIYPFNKMKFF